MDNETDEVLTPDTQREHPHLRLRDVFVENVLNAVISHIKTKNKCKENSMAITKIEEALLWLKS